MVRTDEMLCVKGLGHRYPCVGAVIFIILSSSSSSSLKSCFVFINTIIRQNEMLRFGLLSIISLSIQKSSSRCQASHIWLVSSLEAHTV